MPAFQITYYVAGSQHVEPDQFPSREDAEAHLEEQLSKPRIRLEKGTGTVTIFTARIGAVEIRENALIGEGSPNAAIGNIW